MNFRRARTIFLKELVVMLRDRRTLLAMIGVPVVLYPLLFIFGSQAALLQRDKLERSMSRIAVAPGTDPEVLAWLEQIPMVSVLQSITAADDLYAGAVDAVLIPKGPVESALAEGGSLHIEIRYDAAESGSRQAVRRLEEGLSEEGERLLNSRLRARGLHQDFVHPIHVSSTNVASAAKTTGSILGMILPMVMVLMLGVGAFYPAIDLTAGEKERGTFETLLSTPTATAEIVYGKFLAVFCLSVLAGLLNLGSLLATLAFQLAQMESSAQALQISLPFGSVLLIALILLPLALLISAVMMSVAMFARSFKEAQNFMTPFFILILFPALFAAIPGTELTPALQFAPIANVALLFKSLMTEPADAETVLAVFLSTAAYAVLALMAAVWMFQREEIILAEERGLPITLRRSAYVPRSEPTPGMAVFLFALALLLIFYAGTYVQSRALIGGLLVTQWLLILAPTILFLWYTRVDLVSALSLHRPSASAFLGGVVAAMAWAVLVVQLSYWHNRVFPMPEQLAREMARIVEGRESGLAFWTLILAAAVSPAICEETLFRGAIFSGLRARLPGWAAILLVGILFGILHISIHRILITAASGVFLGYLVYRSGSLFTSIAAHFLINGAALLMATRLEPLLDAWRIEQRGIPWWVLLVAAAVFALGIYAVERGARKPDAPPLVDPAAD